MAIIIIYLKVIQIRSDKPIKKTYKFEANKFRGKFDIFIGRNRESLISLEELVI